MGEVYNSQQVPYGGFVISNLMRAGAAVTGNYIVENFTVARPTKKIERPDQIGGPNGFALVRAQETASGVIQIATSSTNNPQVGDNFTQTLDANFPNEKWVIETIGQPYEMNGYYKQNVTFIKSYV